MNAQVEIPSALRGFTNNRRVIDVAGGTVQEVFATLLDQYGQLRNHLYDEQGKVRSFINIYVNDEDIRYAQELQTPVKEGDVVHIIPSIAGG